LAKIGAATGFELRYGFSSLFDHLLDDRQNLHIIEQDALVDFALLDAGIDQTDRGQALFFTGAHRGLHVLGDALFESHVA